MTDQIFPDWKQKVVFSQTGPQPVALYEDDKIKVVVAGLIAGQAIPPHPEGQGVYHFLQGNGWMTLNDERLAVNAGATVITNVGDSRGIEADTDLAFLATRVAMTSS